MKKKREDGSRYFYAPKGENLMKKRMRMTMKIEKTFKDGCEDYLLDCKARNLREGMFQYFVEPFCVSLGDKIDTCPNQQKTQNKNGRKHQKRGDTALQPAVG